MEKSTKIFIQNRNSGDFDKPKCIVCGNEIQCIVEVPTETCMHIKCFNEVKNGMKNGMSERKYCKTCDVYFNPNDCVFRHYHHEIEEID